MDEPCGPVAFDLEPGAPPLAVQAMIAVAFRDDRQPLVVDPYDWEAEAGEEDHG